MKKKEKEEPVDILESTIGFEALALQKENEKINPVDLQKTIHKGNKSKDSLENQVFECIERGRKSFEKDFYIVILFKKERLLPNVVRQYFIPRLSCPTPEYDQVVYKYHYTRDELEFLWVVPDQETTQNIPLFDNFLPEEQKALIQYARMFKNGDLDKKCAELNRENIA